MPSKYEYKFGVKVEKCWGFSIGACFSVTPPDCNNKREKYLFINLGKITISIGILCHYPETEDELR